MPAVTPEKSGTAARHTHDVGYSKWEKFDVDAALAELDQPLPRKEVAKLVQAPPIDRSLEPMELLDAAIARLQEPSESNPPAAKPEDDKAPASSYQPKEESSSMLTNTGVERTSSAGHDAQEAKYISVDMASTTAHKLSAEYEKWQGFEADLEEVDDDEGTDFFMDSSGLDLNALTGPEEEVSQIRAHWRREARKMAQTSKSQCEPKKELAGGPIRNVRENLQASMDPVLERPSVCGPATSPNAMEQSYSKWKNFDADAALLQLDNEETTEEGKTMRLNADQGSAFLSTEGYTKEREEYDLDQDIQRNMGNLKQILAQNFKDASALKADGNEMLQAGQPKEAIARYTEGLATLQLASHASVLMTASLADKQCLAKTCI